MLSSSISSDWTRLGDDSKNSSNDSSKRRMLGDDSKNFGNDSKNSGKNFSDWLSSGGTGLGNRMLSGAMLSHRWVDWIVC